MDERQTTQDSSYHPLFESNGENLPASPLNKPGPKTIFKHTALFLITFACVSLAGADFVGYQTALFPVTLPTLSDVGRGAIFAALILAFLGIHEFGHYFAAVYHKIRVTLPYFIPIPLGIGTLGAVIRIKQKINHSYEMFDVGAAGPLAGFAVAIGILLYGFSTLPDPSYMLNFEGHQALGQYLQAYGSFPKHPLGASARGTMVIGNTLLYGFIAHFFTNVPPMWEMYHYPFLFAGWLGLFFTALNLTPVGQLDGGHILYSLIGFEKHRIVARVFFTILVTMGGIQIIPPIHLLLGNWDTANGVLSLLIWACLLFILLGKAFHNDYKWMLPVFIISFAATSGYLYLNAGTIITPGSVIWAVWSFFLAFFAGVEHPPALHEKPLSTTRKIVGWSSMAIFILCISPSPIYLS